LVVDIVAYPLLIALTVARAVRHPRLLWADLVNPRLVFSFFTFVAGSSVLGLQFFLRDVQGVAVARWVVGVVAWLVRGDGRCWVLPFLGAGSGADVVHGGWLIAIVGTGSLALRGARVAPELGARQDPAFVTVYTLWGVGIVF